MEWPKNSSNPKWISSCEGWLGALVRWFAGSEGGDAGPGDLGEAEMRRIRAKQIDAVARLIPITMAVNIVSGGIVLALFWGMGWDGFLSVWALSLAMLALLAACLTLQRQTSVPEQVAGVSSRMADCQRKVSWQSRR